MFLGVPAWYLKYAKYFKLYANSMKGNDMEKKKTIPLKLRKKGVKKFHKHASHSCSMTLTEEVPKVNKKPSK